MIEDFSGDYRVMRVMFATSDPINTLHNLKHVYSYKTFIEMYEYLDAKETIDEDIRQRMVQSANNKKT